MNNGNRKLVTNRNPLTSAPGAQPVGTAIRAVVGGPVANEEAQATRARHFDDVESRMSRNWAAVRAASGLSWARAMHATRDAWNRISPSS